MAVQYTTLESVRDSYMGIWKDEWDAWTEKMIPLVSDMLRSYFVPYGQDLDQKIIDGKVGISLVEMVANNMLIRKISASDNGLGVAGAMDFKSLSASAGPYSATITPLDNSTNNLHIRADEKKLLGIPNFAVGGINLRYFKEDPDVSN